ncbi:MAG: NAD(P)H-dependent oxidoreductase subunit E [Bacilli bacterium]|nr:NAD(P)H-dependent oxidoreductase subunit E [Bacilli bacterium]
MNKEIDEIIKNSESLIEMLQKIQKIDGYLYFERLFYLSEKLDMSLEDIYSTATFYNGFSFNMKGKYQINICLGTVCYVKGSKELSEEISKILNIKDGECTKDGKFSLDTTRCLGCCSMAPVMKINDDIYGFVKKEQVKEILAKYN